MVVSILRFHCKDDLVLGSSEGMVRGLLHGLDDGVSEGLLVCTQHYILR